MIRVASFLILTSALAGVSGVQADDELDRTVAGLVRALADPDARGRQAAQEGLTRLGAKAVPALKRELDKAPPEVKDRLKAIIAAAEKAADAAANSPAILQKVEGHLIDVVLENLAPPSGAVTDQDTLEKLCKAWKFTGVPEVNWETELIVVATTPGKNKFDLKKPLLLKENDLAFKPDATKEAGKGFSFVVAKVGPRNKIKTINGKPLPAPAAKPPEKPKEEPKKE